MVQETSQPLPKRFGRYRIHSKLAAGGMATVYLAQTRHQSGFEKVVALKVIHDHLADEEAFVEMFLDEARIAAGIDHPNVCSVFDFGKHEGVNFLAMEFLLGEPLKRILKTIAKGKDREEIKRLPWYAARVVADTCEGLHAAHELRGAEGEHLGVVHRDVSPENILVTYDGGVKVVDFGVAKAAERIHETKVAKVKGKYAYVAPEQLHNEGVDRRSDLWSLGVCLWEALTLRRLFRRDSDAGTLSAVINHEIRPPSVVAPWVPPALDPIVMRALSRDREGRYPTARAMGQDLRRFLTESGITVGTAEVSEWMDRLFPHEKEARLARLREARQGRTSSEFELDEQEAEESSASDSELPSVSALVSADEAASLRIGTSLDDLAALLSRQGRRCPGEVLGLIAMDACDELHGRAATLDGELIRVTDHGAVSVVSPPEVAKPAEAARSLVEALRAVPIEAGEVADLLREAEFRSPDELNGALQRAIDPLARGRARRRLAELVRSRPGGPSAEALRRASEPTARIRTEPPPAQRASEIDLDLPDPEQLARKMKARRARNALIALALLGGGGYALVRTQPQLFEAPPTATDAGAPTTTLVAEPRTGTLTIHTETPGARVLRFAGRAPVEIPDVPRDAPVFATLQGHPARWASVPADADWGDPSDPRYELAVQLSESDEESPPPPLADAGDITGTLRVVTTPPSAKVFYTVGAGPEVTLAELPTNEVIELLVVAEGFEPRREVISPERWVDSSELEVEVTLTPRDDADEGRHRR